MLKAHFDQLAAYNRWANRRLYTDAASLPDATRKRPEGLFFGSIHGTLNHLLVADYIWMRRFTGDGPQPERLNQILHEDFEELRTAREAEDERIFDFVTGDRQLRPDAGIPELKRQDVPASARSGVDALLQSSGASPRAGPCGADDHGDSGAGVAGSFAAATELVTSRAGAASLSGGGHLHPNHPRFGLRGGVATVPPGRRGQ